MGDIFIFSIFDRHVFSWDSSGLSKSGEIKQNYLDTIYKDGKGVFKPLIKFTHG